MGDEAGNAAIELLYDIDAVIRETNPSEKVRRFGIESRRYLVLKGTDRRFPEDVLLIKDITWFPKRTLLPPTDNLPYFHQGWKEYNNPQQTSVGETYPVTLVKTVLDIQEESKKRKLSFGEGGNDLFFEPGEFNRRLAEAEEDFFTKLDALELNPVREKIYHRLFAPITY